MRFPRDKCFCVRASEREREVSVGVIVSTCAYVAGTQETVLGLRISSLITDVAIIFRERNMFALGISVCMCLCVRASERERDERRCNCFNVCLCR